MRLTTREEIMPKPTFKLATQFCGPPHSGNGGYFCGLIAEHFTQPLSIRLKAPPPLNTRLTIEGDDHNAEVMAGPQTIASLKFVHAPPEASPPIALEDARNISDEGLQNSRVNHPFPNCFVCGPKRQTQDGMRIFTGPSQNKTLYAAHWYAEPCWSSDGTYIDTRFIWAAMDCPSSGPAFATTLDPHSQIAYVLGTLELHIEHKPKIRNHYIITCTLDEDNGKVYKTRVSLYDEEHKLHARGAAVWVQVKRSLFHTT